MPQYGGIVGVGYGSGVGVAPVSGGADIEVLHDPNIVDPIPILYSTPGSKQATTAVDVAAVKALTAGVFTVDGVSTAPIDFSGVPDGTAGLTPITNLITPAINAVPALDGYIVSLAYVAPNFFFVVMHLNGDVGLLSGNIVVAMGLDTITESSHSPKSPSIIIPSPPTGYWRELRFFSTLAYRNLQQQSTFRSTYISDGTDTYSWLSALSNTGAWFELVSSNEPSGLYNIGKATVYSSTTADFFYNPVTGEITWDNTFNTIPSAGAVYKMSSLFVLGTRGS